MLEAEGKESGQVPPSALMLVEWEGTALNNFRWLRIRKMVSIETPRHPVLPVDEPLASDGGLDFPYQAGAALCYAPSPAGATMVEAEAAASGFLWSLLFFILGFLF